MGFAFSYYGAVMIVTRIFEEGVDANNNAERVTFDYSAIFVSSTAELVATFIIISLVDKIGRIPTQAFSYFTGGVALLILCFCSTHNASKIVLIVVAFYVRMCEMAGTCVTWISTAELLSTEIRSTGHSAANAVARIGGFCAPFLIAGDVSLITIGIVMLVVHSVTAFCASMLPETKGTKLGKAVVETMATDNHSVESSGSMELI